MNHFDFVSHETFPEDPYIKEVVVLSFPGDVPNKFYHVAYCRKPGKEGGLFWGVASAGMMKNGAKVYIKAFEQDSKFLEKDILKYLDNRSWEKYPKEISVQKKPENHEEIPFWV